MKKNILISGLGGSLFPYLHHQLNSKFNLVYVDSDKTLLDLYPNFNFFPAPLVNDDHYIDFIENLIQKEKIDIYIPLIDEEIQKAHVINNNRDDLILISPTDGFSKLCLNKHRLMQFLKEHDISSIETCTGVEIGDVKNFPLFVKPIYGRGSRGIRRIDSINIFEAYVLLEKYKKEDILVQELVEGQEYTVGVLTNPNNDILSISSKKVLLKKGITIHAVTEDNPVIDAVVRKINEVMQPRGPYNVQLFIDKDGSPRIFEINPRFSTTSIMSYAGGVDEISTYLEYYDRPFEASVIRPQSGLHLRRNWNNNFYV